MSKKRILITGAEGFLGSFASKAIRHQNWEAIPLTSDLRDGKAVRQFCRDAGELDCVLHFASISHPATCEKEPDEAFAVNTLGTLNLLEGLLPLVKKPRFAFFSTAQVYAPSEQPLNEEDLTLPISVYARTKFLAEKLVETYSQIGGIPSTIFRLFNHSHQSQTNLYFLPSIYGKLRSAPNEKTEINVGNLNLIRDFSSITDFQQNLVEFLISAEKGSSFEILNWCSGRSYSLEKLANSLADRLGKSARWKQNISDKDALIPLKIVGNPDRFMSRCTFNVTHRSEEEFITQFLSEKFL